MNEKIIENIVKDYNVERDDAINVLETLKQMANNGKANAQSDLGNLYCQAGDYTLAIEWWQKAALKGYAQAQYNLGNQYLKGVCVPQSYHQAAYWYQKAANQGHKDAVHNLELLRKYHAI